MSKIKFELYGNECEVREFLLDGENILVFEFQEEYEGFVRIGEITSRLNEGKCAFDLRLLPNEEMHPVLVIPNGVINLPTFKKLGRAIELLDCTEDYIRRASQRERALEKRILELEMELREISERIYKTTIL